MQIHRTKRVQLISLWTTKCTHRCPTNFSKLGSLSRLLSKAGKKQRSCCIFAAELSRHYIAVCRKIFTPFSCSLVFPPLIRLFSASSLALFKGWQQKCLPRKREKERPTRDNLCAKYSSFSRLGCSWLHLAIIYCLNVSFLGMSCKASEHRERKVFA